ncbi:lytic murein transglycosylase B [Candidatus Thioglobus sp.]|jgi:membrane-bound lytic murein transglycosylase B|uniref:lytic murein transglycosylase B n=1 Tax=Candidatus Thioglobus sp. TaxID=2026721 RepID=UPI001D5DA5C0|nr:lytic murein transglycosylase B [Candidatus Thioglobus sp.]MBT3277501.1 lytic murein transglycosylase B [Candidatus Thioglobus sp.]MBT3446408.1 lytic murein transglycosylase B [Candidatus Thioglobus sp.]MBT3745020.1 lytic murein transglycosylase B [Candidatus Thioglobus sp.]MBT4001211.1 lytic murein transglycosylase B [Candidatus Thioglobus sp.]MBT4747328.1 lytic murein transglycosylase B [Candidatus Thioglobus sp.]
MPVFALLFLLFSQPVVAKTLPATDFQATHNFINKMVSEHHFNKNELLSIFSKVNLIVAEKKQKLTAKKTKSKPMSWDKYRSLFITDTRIKNGIEFWKNNLETLKRAEKTYNVPQEIIVAILGIETNYGHNQGKHPVLETLARLSFGKHRRKKFYKKELQEFLLMSRENTLAPLLIKGSYAGALGYAQFISSSYRYYAVDFDFDGKVDLFSSPVDAIGSIANYFDKHQWHDFGAYARPITLKNSQLKQAKSSTNKPKKNAKYWRSKGFRIDSDINDKTKLAFIKLPQDNNSETWLTFWNFYVLTRYNHDNRYAMTAVHLSEKLKQQFNLTHP